MSTQSTWSEPVSGLAGRMYVELEDLRPGLRYAVMVELRNHSFQPIAVITGPEIHADLHDHSGNAAAASNILLSGPAHEPQWGVIPRDAYLGFRIDLQTAGVPTGTALLAVGNRQWEPGAGTFILTVTLRFESRADGPPNQWTGSLALPPVTITAAATR